MKSLGSIGSFLSALSLVLLAFVCMGNSFQQELGFYDAQNNVLQFHSNVADTSDHSLFLAKVTKMCTRGVWFLSSSENFESSWITPGSVSNASLLCGPFTAGTFVKSVRHMGADDTDTDALSLYEGDLYSGKEHFVTSQVYTGIKNHIQGIAITGAGVWMLFEGQELDGNSRCFGIQGPGSYLSYNFVYSLRLNTIGSVFKGCDAQEIQNYKMLHKSAFVNAH